MDDIHPIRPLAKFAVQAAAACVAYVGGLQLVSLELPWVATIALGWLSLPATVFWFLLVINAINLPLTDDKFTYGSLHLEKDIRNDPISHYTLRRIEHLRRAVVRKTRALEESARSRLRGLAAESAASKEAGRRIKEEAILSGSGRAKA
jgi:hypothetical protein